ncbi:hypothetical protein GEO95_23170, partial [Salmonella enterica subsp. enterica serovar Anatum]|nr:hypothetical protein [Salmonella enterica subsp. enterica serovar Anatum]
SLPWGDFIWPFALPTLAGNICGGTFIFALLSHAQVRNDMSNKRKAEARAQAAGKAKTPTGHKKSAQNGEGLSSQTVWHLLRRAKNAILVPPCPLS